MAGEIFYSQTWAFHRKQRLFRSRPIERHCLQRCGDSGGQTCSRKKRGRLGGKVLKKKTCNAHVFFVYLASVMHPLR